MVVGGMLGMFGMESVMSGALLAVRVELEGVYSLRWCFGQRGFVV